MCLVHINGLYMSVEIRSIFFLLPVKHLHKYKMQRVGGRAREAYYKVKFLRQVTAFLFTSKFTEFTCSNYCADMV